MADQAQAEVGMQGTRALEVYVGPRPFERSEQDLFFGRDREISELLSLVISSRAVLCYAPSGAGKTSLVNAGLLPRLEEEGFEVLPSTRVRGLIPEGIDHAQVPNLYVFNALLSLAGDEAAPGELAGRTLSETLTAREHRLDEEGFPAPRVLIFDQFEELLTSYPERWQERDGFFQQVRNALHADPLLRVLFIMREDFLARIEPFMRLLKPFGQARFRLALLGPDGALSAVTGPLRGTGRHFKEGVAAALIDELLKVRVETAQGEAVEVSGEYVEPVQLQVVCRNLWTSLPPDVQEISQEHLEAYGDVDQALKGFYESCLSEAKTGLGANEKPLREWFEEQLITPAGTRGIVFRDAKLTAGLPNPVVDFLENRHLIRGEWRAGSRWYELTHDRLIEPIQRANLAWRSVRQVRRNRLVMLVTAAGVTLLLMLALIPTLLYRLQTAATALPVSAETAVAAQTTATVAAGQASQANQDAALSRSRQLAAQAPLEADPSMALLLAIEANNQANLPEARKSLHTVLSRQGVIDGQFLRELDPAIISPRIVMRLQGHRNWVLSVAFSPDSRRFVSGSADASLNLWDVDNDTAVFSLSDPQQAEVLSVAFSPSGNRLASGDFDGQIVLWDAFTGQPIGAPLAGHTGQVLSVAFSPDGTLLASGGQDGTVRIWDVSTGNQTTVLEGLKDVWSIAWSPDGKYLASGGIDSAVHLWETGFYSEVGLLTGHRGTVRSVTWSPDGGILASAAVEEGGRQATGEVILWDFPTRAEIVRPLRENSQPVRTVAFDPTGTILAMGWDDGTITLWDTRSELVIGDPLKGHTKQVYSVAFSPDGRYLVSGSLDNTVVLWDLYAPTNSVAFSPTGNLMAASQAAELTLWDLSSNLETPVTTLSGHTEDVLAIKFYNDGIFASAGRDDTIRLWDDRTGELIGPPLKGHRDDIYTLDFSPDGKYLVSAGQDGTVLLWDLDARLGLGASLLNFPGPLLRATYDPDGKRIYLGGRDGSLVTLDPTSGEIQTESLPAMQAGQTLTSLAFSRDGRQVAYFRDVDIPAEASQTGFLIPTGGPIKRAHGIQISFWDQSFDPTVNPGDIDFVIVKATEGNTFTDPKFDEFYQAARSIPIRGAYHFYRPNVPWQEQADYFLSVVKDKDFHFFVLDLEVSSDDKSTSFVSDALQWLSYVDEHVEQKVVLETLPSFYNTWLSSSREQIKAWPLFLISFAFEPDRNGNPVLPNGIASWDLWLYSDDQQKAAAYGLGGSSVPLAVFNGSVSDMWGWLAPPVFTIYDRDSGARHDLGGQFRAAGMNDLAFSPDGKFVASAGELTVSIWDTNSGAEVATLPVAGLKVTSLSFNLDGSLLAIGRENGTILLWDLRLLTMGTDSGPVLEAACSLAGRNFTEEEWTKFLGETPRQKTCPEWSLE